MSAAAGLELRQQVADMALDRLLREEEPDADLAVHEAVRDELQHFDLTRGGFLLQLLKRGLKGDHLRNGSVAPGRDRLETGRVLAITAQDLIALCSVHDRAIGQPMRWL